MTTQFPVEYTPATSDGSGNYTGGFVFSAGEAINIESVGYWHNGFSPPSAVEGGLWDPSDSSSVATTGSQDVTGEAGNTWVDFALAYALDPATDLIVAFYIPAGGASRYDGTALAAPVTDGVITIAAGGGRFHSGGGAPVYPASTWPGGVGMHAVRIGYTVAGDVGDPGAATRFFAVLGWGA